MAIEGYFWMLGTSELAGLSKLQNSGFQCWDFGEWLVVDPHVADMASSWARSSGGREISLVLVSHQYTAWRIIPVEVH